MTARGSPATDLILRSIAKAMHLEGWMQAPDTSCARVAITLPLYRFFLQLYGCMGSFFDFLF
jgi:hypothetical protein